MTGRDPIALDQPGIMRLKDFSQKTIKGFSHAKDKEKINQYVDDHFAIRETFALGIPVSVFVLISRTIRGFSDKP
jgi:hypothetical protein